jgi:hypothetical protein
MTGEPVQSKAINQKDEGQSPPQKKPTPAAERALAEAEQRRRSVINAQRPKEISGRGGPDPARYGDWEVKGIASDF